MSPGDIYWVQIPAADGHEQAGLRPALILQNPQLTARLTTIQIVPLTSRLKARRFPATLVIDPDLSNHLSARSVALICLSGEQACPLSLKGASPIFARSTLQVRAIVFGSFARLAQSSVVR